MLANRLPESPKMGGGAFSISELPLSLSLAAIGVGGMYLAGITPSPIKQIITVGGIGFVVWGILNLFSGEARADIGPNVPFKTPVMEDFSKVSVKIIKPSLNEEVPRGLFSADYDVEVIWTNSSSNPVALPYQIYVEEKPRYGIAASPFNGIVKTGIINLKAGESMSVPLEIDLQHRGFGAAPVTAIRLIVRKVAPSGQAFDAASTVFFVY